MISTIFIGLQYFSNVIAHLSLPFIFLIISLVFFSVLITFDDFSLNIIFEILSSYTSPPKSHGNEGLKTQLEEPVANNFPPNII